jgi:hypothetical protein
VGGLVLAAVAAVWGQAQAAQSAEVTDFEARLAKYVQLRKTAPKAENRKTTDSPDKLMEQRDTIKSRVLAGRPNAKQGDIFTPEITTYFRHQIDSTLSGAQGARIRASLRHAEPVKMKLGVNKTYPSKIPLQSTPPSLLLNLPPLPKDLEYRIVGRALVLHDIGANLVVDYIPDVLPQS